MIALAKQIQKNVYEEILLCKPKCFENGFIITNYGKPLFFSNSQKATIKK